MTPEQKIAAELGQNILAILVGRADGTIGWVNPETVRHRLTTAYRLELEAEREACAQVAEVTEPPEESTAWTGNSGWAHAQQDIAAAIRARSARPAEGGAP